jgi:hypothetical protein
LGEHRIASEPEDFSYGEKQMVHVVIGEQAFLNAPLEDPCLRTSAFRATAHACTSQAQASQARTATHLQLIGKTSGTAACAHIARNDVQRQVLK